MNFIRINCQEEFLSNLKGVSEPEAKREIIGTEFYKVFWNKIREDYGTGFFAQGTIYPDRIESGKGDAAKIKTHLHITENEIYLLETGNQCTCSVNNKIYVLKNTDTTKH